MNHTLKKYESYFFSMNHTFNKYDSYLSMKLSFSRDSLAVVFVVRVYVYASVVNCFAKRVKLFG